MKNYQIVLIFLYVVVTVGACRKNQTPEDALRYIPGDVTMVTRIDIASMMKKMDYEEVKKLPFFAENAQQVKQSNPLISRILMDPEKSGIDLNHHMYIVGWADPKGDHDFTIGTVCSVRDAQSLADMMQSGGNQEIVRENGIWKLKDEQGVIWWNDRIAALLAGPDQEVTKKFAAQLFAAQPAAPVSGNKDLKRLLSEKHDISTWIQSNALAEIQEIKFGAGSINIEVADLKDNYIHASMDFEKGEILALSHFFLKKGLIKDIQLLVKDEVKTNFSAYFPEEASSVTALALDFNGIRQVMAENLMLKKVITEGLEDTGLTLDDLTKALQGDVLLTTFALDGNQTGLAALRINDRNIIQKWMQLGVKHGILEQTGADMYRLKDAPPSDQGDLLKGNISLNGNTRILVQKDMLVLANDEKTAAKITAGGFAGGGSRKKAMQQMMHGHLFSNVIRMAFLSTDHPEDMLPAFDEIQTQLTRKGSQTRIRMKDTEVNSLQSIIHAMNEAYLKNKSGATEKTI